MGLSSLSRDLGLCHACLRASGRACRECETINAASDLPSCHRCSESRVALWCSDCTSPESRSLSYCHRCYDKFGAVACDHCGFVGGADWSRAPCVGSSCESVVSLCGDCEALRLDKEALLCASCWSGSDRLRILCGKTPAQKMLKMYRCCRTFTTTLWSHAPVAAAFLRMLRNASRTFRAGTGPSGPQSVTCPSGPLNQAADGRRHFYWCLPDIAPFVFWRPRGMFSITSCLQCSQDSIVRTVFAGGQIWGLGWAKLS